jgi:hypothetical protein
MQDFPIKAQNSLIMVSLMWGWGPFTFPFMKLISDLTKLRAELLVDTFKFSILMNISKIETRQYQKWKLDNSAVLIISGLTKSLVWHRCINDDTDGGGGVSSLPIGSQQYISLFEVTRAQFSHCIIPGYALKQLTSTSTFILARNF